MKEIKLIAKSVVYYSPGDEDVFFEWIQKIKSIKKFDGIGEELYLYFSNKRIPRKDLAELFGLFERYNIDRDQLKIFKNESNKIWFEDGQ
jgi:N6-adenosine-specific RNA methylase IME4